MKCVKRSYPDKKAVTTAMKIIERRRRNRPKNLRSYYCFRCRGWHLTHQPERVT
jgi:hypothetical protein